MHYRALPLASKVVEGLPEMQTKHEGVCKGCAKGKNTKKTFPSSESKAKGILEILHSDVCGPMSSNSLRGSVYYVVTERNSHGLGYHNRNLDSRNQSFPICKRNQRTNTKGSRFVPYFGQLM